MDASPSTKNTMYGERTIGAEQHVSRQQSRLNQAQDPSCVKYTCERCKEMVRPCADTLPDWKTHLIAGLLFIIGLPFFCFLPYCFDLFGKRVNRCPRCGAFMNTNADAPRTTT